MSRRMPAEWEAHAAILMSFPRRAGDWGNLLKQVSQQYLALVITIAEVTPVWLIVSDEAWFRDSIRSSPFALDFTGANEIPTDSKLSRGQLAGDILIHEVTLYFMSTDDVWARDFGPLTIIENGQVKLLDFTFNGWGNKYTAALDNTINQRLSVAGLFGNTPLETIPLVLEGGSIESDGQGTILTTSQCLLHPARNPELSQDEITLLLRKYLGAKRVLYLDYGHLVGDDTDAHIDTLARFAAPDTIIYQACDDPTDAHYDSFQAMANQLASFRQSNGAPYRLVPLPWYPPTYSQEDGRRLPGTYANFLITNGAIIVPGAGTQQDEAACLVLATTFPGYRILLIDAGFFLEQHGSVHCMTMQLPRIGKADD
ncbi:MAG: agmatine deiminase family protein [Bacteroidota bacterium]